MSASACPQNQQRPSSFDKDVVFVAQASRIAGTRAVIRSRGAVHLPSVIRGRQGRFLRDTGRPVRRAPSRRGEYSRCPLVSRPVGVQSVNRSASSTDEDVMCLGSVATERDKFIPRCVL